MTAFLGTLLSVFLLASAQTPGAEPTPPSPPPVPAKLERYAQWLLKKHDANQDGRLQPAEWTPLPKGGETLDRNGDQVVTTDEIAADAWEYALRSTGVLQRTQEEASTSPSPANPQSAASQSAQRRDLRFYVRPGRVPEGLPEWFHSRDQDGDAQLTLAEYSPDGRGDLSEFHRLDVNSDGVLTAAECLGRKSEKAPQPPTPSQTGSPPAAP